MPMLSPKKRAARNPLGVVDDPVATMWMVSVRILKSGAAKAYWSRLDPSSRQLVVVGLPDPEPTLWGYVQMPEALVKAAADVLGWCEQEEELPS